MSRLTVSRDSDPNTVLLSTQDGAAIAKELATIGVRFERWALGAPLPAGADNAAVLAAYAADIDRLKAEGGYQAVDVVRIAPDHPDRAAMRTKFLAEHRHSENEVRFFVEGAGQFYLRVTDHVHMVLCEAGDLLSVPAGVRHWFDMGPVPHFTAIRLLTNPEGWVAQFTGDSIAESFPRFEVT
jgi:1,2-dihydroxy-3-keto-5-methylthiopentene dioxygenase